MHTTIRLIQSFFADSGLAALPGPLWRDDDAMHGCECALPFLTGLGDAWPGSEGSPGAAGAASVNHTSEPCPG